MLHRYALLLGHNDKHWDMQSSFHSFKWCSFVRDTIAGSLQDTGSNVSLSGMVQVLYIVLGPHQ